MHKVAEDEVEEGRRRLETRLETRRQRATENERKAILMAQPSARTRAEPGEAIVMASCGQCARCRLQRPTAADYLVIPVTGTCTSRYKVRGLGSGVKGDVDAEVESEKPRNHEER